MRNFVNQRSRELKPSGIRKFFDIVSEMKDAISLGVGEPDFITPWHIRNAAIKSIQRGYTQYTGNRGLPVLRELISRYMNERFGVEYPAENIIVTVGASEGIDLVMRAICDPGDEVLVPDPGYVSYSPCVTLSGGVPVHVPCRQENAFILTPEQLERAITPRTKAIILPYPNNPTGGIMPKEQLEAIAPVLEKHDLLIVSDEIYAELTYLDNHVSIASIPGMRERTIVINGFSKSHAMTGWRLGYACGPEVIIKQMLKIHQFAIMCAPTTSQYAAVEALRNGDEDVAMMREEYNGRRRYVLERFKEMGLSCFEPFGAFYAFPCIKDLGMTSDEFATKLLQTKKVAVVPGTAFGACGEGFLRISYAYSLDDLRIALDRVAEFVTEIREIKN